MDLRSYWLETRVTTASPKLKRLPCGYGYIPVPPYNDEKIIAGQGTIGLEILEDMKDVEMVLVPE